MKRENLHPEPSKKLRIVAAKKTIALSHENKYRKIPRQSREQSHENIAQENSAPRLTK
jgi:hypothetical protein